MSKKKRTPWTQAEMNEFVRWHEDTIQQYPEEVIREFRRARQKFISMVPITKNLVWVNTISTIYYHTGDRWYGKTKVGRYMEEAEAQSLNARPYKNNR
jgi:hypothetical protein